MEPVMVLNRKINTRVSSKNVIANPVGVKQSITVLSFTLLLAACGGDCSSGAKDPELAEGNDTDLMVETFDDLLVCSSKREGTTAYVKDEKNAYVCVAGDWTLDGDDPAEKSSSSKKTSSSSGMAKSSSSSIKLELSSSVDDPQLSSSEKSSSSETSVYSSSSTDEIKCQELLEGETNWNWDVPKECRFNPDIDYGTMTDERDGKVYKTVKIGDQTWMAENLNYADSTKTPSLKGKSWCFNDRAANCDVVGHLYTWAAAIDSVKLATDADNPQDCGYGKTCDLASAGSATLVQGICPEGWHLPSYDEWKTLFDAVGGQDTASKVLKSQTGWPSNGYGTDAFGFSALPVGGKNDVGYFGAWSTYFWSSTEVNSGHAYDVYLFYGLGNAGLAGLAIESKILGFSVRCLRD